MLGSGGLHEKNAEGVGVGTSYLYCPLRAGIHALEWSPTMCLLPRAVLSRFSVQSNGSQTSFQVLEAARDLLKQSQDSALTSLYFYDLSDKLERLLIEVGHRFRYVWT